MDVVMIPACDRPEFLAVCLEHIAKAKHAEEHLYLFRLDEGCSPENYAVIENWPFLRELSTVTENPSERKIMFNMLEGYRFAQQLARKLGSGLIHMIEEDIFIGPDYFAVARELHQKYRPWCVTLCDKQPRLRKLENDPRKFYSANRYHSWGVSFPVDSLNDVVRHSGPQLWKNSAREAYFEKLWPAPRIVTGNSQDALIEMIVNSSKLKVIFPHTPRAYHAGWFGLNRVGELPKGTLQERINKVRETSGSAAAMNAAAGSHRDHIRPAMIDHQATDLLLVD